MKGHWELPALTNRQRVWDPPPRPSHTPEGGEPSAYTLDSGVPGSQEFGGLGCECSIPALRALLLARDDLTASRPARA